MSARLRRLGWIPPLLVGASTAIAAEVALGMLLYAGPGLVRSLTTVLAGEVAALGGGLWTAARPGTDGIDRLRKKWLLCLFSFSIATIYGVAWSVSQHVGEGPISKGMRLDLLAGFPLYTSGVVLGGMASLSTRQNDGRWQASLATLGAALGFMITGLLLTRVPMPAIGDSTTGGSSGISSTTSSSSVNLSPHLIGFSLRPLTISSRETPLPLITLNLTPGISP